MRTDTRIEKLDATRKYSYCPLNTDPFLDLAGYLKSLPHSDDPQEVFETLRDITDTIANAQNIIDQMLKQQAKQQAAP